MPGPCCSPWPKTTAEQIRQALLADAGARQLGLFQEYLRTCRRTNGVVFAIDNDVVMLNDYARTMLDAADQAALLAHAVEAQSPNQRGPVSVQLPSGVTARMYCRPVGAGRAAGVVVHVRLGDAEPALTSSTGELIARPLLPGLVGSAPPWLRACQEVERVFRSGEWLALEGEAGVGKLAVLQAVHLLRRPAGRFVVLDATEAETDDGWLDGVRQALAQDADSLVVRHVDRLDEALLIDLSATLQVAAGTLRATPLWVALTLSTDPQSAALHELLRLFPSSVEVPPLRLHLEDLEQLVSFMLARLGYGGQLDCSQEAMRLLMRMPWPGNAEQVEQVLGQVVKHRRAGHILVADLPPEARVVSRKRLSPLERLERDAIVQSLRDANGNKVEAARSLEMSRATIYRKIHEYGIVTTQT